MNKILFLIILSFSACKQKDSAVALNLPFERTKWDMKTGRQYTFRKQMIPDLINNFTWQGLKKDSVLHLLGEPDGMEDETFMLYHYDQKFLVGNFPLSTQSLVIELNRDSTVKLARPN